MAIPTGYTFFDINDGQTKDFADVFSLASPQGTGGQTTHYLSNAYSGLDLGQIFAPGTGSGKTTNYFNSINQDLGSIFALKNPWSALGSGCSNTVNTIAIDSHNNVYVGGQFVTAGGITVNNIAKWDGSNWSGLNGGISSTDPSVVVQVSDIVIDLNDNVYICGRFDTVGGIIAALNVAKWDGSNWSALGSGVTEYSVGTVNFGAVNTITIDNANNYIYVGGFNLILPPLLTIYQVVKCNITGSPSWSSPGALGLLGTISTGVVTLSIDSSNIIYAGGSFTSPYPNLLAKWDGSTWSQVGTGISGTVVYAIDASYSPYVYVGGNITTAGGGSASNIASFNGSTWSILNGGVGGSVFSIKVNTTTSDVYVGGIFSTAGTPPIAVSNVTKWDGTTWDNMSGGVSGETDAIAIDNSNNVYVGGVFNNANTGLDQISASKIAKYAP